MSESFPIEPSRLEQAARDWIASDPDEGTRAELEALLSARDAAGLDERFASPLAFGTAGLRGIVGAGPARMNRAVVIKATRALADYLIAHVPDARTLPVVVGFDARLSSRAFGRDVVGVLSAAGLSVRYFREPVPTPLVAYAQRELCGCAGVVVTASHNPPEYNGYKVFGPNAAQIVPPIDRWIEQRIERVGPAASIRVDTDAIDIDGARPAPIPPSFGDRYLDSILSLRPGGPSDRNFTIVHSALHGVGGIWVKRLLLAAGFASFTSVSEQAEPDGRFPTVAFPNPEEEGALDLALKLAAREKADLVLVNDPDADRLAVAVPTATGRWVRLTGDEVGILLAEQALDEAVAVPQPLVVSTIVSSPLLGQMVKARGARFEQTLTGFKWIWAAALALEREEGVRYVFGYEEALGYSAPPFVRDKDGISAALLVAELAARCRAQGRSLLDKLAETYRRYGLWSSAQRSVVRAGPGGKAAIRSAFEALASKPPTSIEGTRVLRVTDFRREARSRTPWLPADAVVAIDLDDGSRILVRPSGTEPKLKFYAHVRSPLGRGEALSTAKSRASVRATSLLDSLCRGL